MNPSIKVINSTLDFPIFEGADFSFRNKISEIGGKIGFGKTEISKKGIKVVRGLNNINIQINVGDKIGILGPNGSGKTTLLKLLAGIYTPTSGKVEIKGKICSMIDLGFGFHNDATGFENILLSKVMHGESIDNVKEIYDLVEEFSGLGEYLDLPFRTYSSGMKSRLALSSALSNVPDILLIDEFFSTGDINFTEKSKNKIKEIIDRSSIMLFASHDLSLINKICSKAIYMKNGSIKYFGDVKEASKKYQEEYK
tara:strand:- start:1344 stop:2105 length:762 start_codon:yes stop_codon:yes gene_type:complete